MDDTLKKKDIVKFIILITFLSSMFICGIIFASKIKEYVNFENVRTLVGENKFLSVLIFILMQILQIVIFIIPGDIINATGGFLFNIVCGSILSFIGVIIGSIIVFYISRFLGYGFINKFVKKEKLDKIVSFFESNTGFISLFIFCNLPFVPKDVLMYGAGLTPLKPFKTLSIYCLSRIPGIIIWNSMGANLYNQSILGIIITLLILLTFLLLIIIIKKKIDGNKIILIKPSIND